VIGFDNLNQKVEMTYFPKAMTDYGDWVQWVALRDKAENEAFQINAGYHQPLTEKRVPGYDSALITSVEYRKQNRIYFSEKHVLGSFIDGWRDIKPSYFKDFCPEYGEIIATRGLGNYLVSVLENAIIRHFYDDREIKSDDDGLRIMMGTSYKFLSDNFVKIASFGSMHKHGLVKSDFSLYGTDMKRGIIWKVVPTASADGSMFLVAEDLTEKHGIISWLETIKACYMQRSDMGIIGGGDETRSNPGSDAPLLYGNGLSGGFNKKYKEVYLTYSWKNHVSLCDGRTEYTLILSELIQGVVGIAPFASMIYMNIDEQFLSVRYREQDNYSYPTEDVYLHDI
jgi:hypothetical protein